MEKRGLGENTAEIGFEEAGTCFLEHKFRIRLVLEVGSIPFVSRFALGLPTLAACAS